MSVYNNKEREQIINELDYTIHGIKWKILQV